MTKTKGLYLTINQQIKKLKTCSQEDMDEIKLENIGRNNKIIDALTIK